MAMPSLTRFCFTSRRTGSVTSTISLRCRVFTGSLAIGCDSMIDVLQKSHTNRAAQPHARRPHQLEFVLPDPIVNHAVAQVATTQRKPQLGQRPGDVPRESH